MRRLPHGEGLYMFVFHSNEALNRMRGHEAINIYTAYLMVRLYML